MLKPSNEAQRITALIATLESYERRARTLNEHSPEYQKIRRKVVACRQAINSILTGEAGKVRIAQYEWQPFMRIDPDIAGGEHREALQEAEVATDQRAAELQARLRRR